MPITVPNRIEKARRCAHSAWIFAIKYKTAVLIVIAVLLGVITGTWVVSIDNDPGTIYWILMVFLAAFIVCAPTAIASSVEKARKRYVYSTLELRERLSSIGVRRPLARINHSPKSLRKYTRLRNRLHKGAPDMTEEDIMDIAALPLAGHLKLSSSPLILNVVVDRGVRGLNNVVETVKAMEDSSVALHEGAL